MARIFGSDGSMRGCFIAFDIDMSNSLGAVVQMPQTSSLRILPDRDRGASYPMVVTSVGFNQSERTFFLKCFGDNIYTYSFGNDVGSVQVDMVAFLAKGVTFSPSNNPSQPVEASAIVDFLNAYNTSRLSRSRESATVSLGQNGSMTGFITKMSISTMDTESNVMKISMTLNTVEVQGDIDNRTLALDPTATTQAQAAQAAGLTGSTPVNDALAAITSDQSDSDVVSLLEVANSIDAVAGVNTSAAISSALSTLQLGDTSGNGFESSLNNLAGAVKTPSPAAREESLLNRAKRVLIGQSSPSVQNNLHLMGELSYDSFNKIRSDLAVKTTFQAINDIAAKTRAVYTLSEAEATAKNASLTTIGSNQ